MDTEEGPVDEPTPTHEPPPPQLPLEEPPKFEEADIAPCPSAVVIPIAGPEGEADVDGGAEVHLAEWHEPEALDTRDYQRDHILVSFHVLCSPEEFKSVNVVLEEKGCKPWLRQMTLLPGGSHWETSITVRRSALSRFAYKLHYGRKAWPSLFWDFKSRAYNLRAGHIYHKATHSAAPSYGEFLQHAFNAVPNGERIDTLLALYRDLSTPFFTESRYHPFLEQFSAAGLHGTSDPEQVLFLALLIGELVVLLLQTLRRLPALAQLPPHLLDVAAKAFRDLFRAAVDMRQPVMSIFMWAPALAAKLPLLVDHIDPGKVRAADPVDFCEAMPLVRKALAVPGVVDNCRRLVEVLIFAAPDLPCLCSVWDLASVLRRRGRHSNQLADRFKDRMRQLANISLGEVVAVYRNLDRGAQTELESEFAGLVLNHLANQSHSEDLVHQTIEFSRLVPPGGPERLSQNLMRSSTPRHRDLVPLLFGPLIVPSLEHAGLDVVCPFWLALCIKSVPKERVLPAIFKQAAALLQHLHPQADATAGILGWVALSLSDLPLAQLLRGHSHADAAGSARLSDLYCSVARSTLRSCNYPAAIDYVNKVNGSASVPLQIANPVMEQLILHALEAVPKPSSVLEVVESGGFWYKVLAATGLVEKAQHHHQTAAVRRVLEQWNAQYKLGDLTIDSIRALRKERDRALVNHLRVLLPDGDYATEKDIQAARAKVEDFSRQLILLQQLVEQCRGFRAIDVEPYQEKLRECNATFGTFTLGQLATNNLLAPFSAPTYAAARILERWEGSATFRNVVATFVDAGKLALTVKEVSRGLYPAAEAKYKLECKKLEEGLADILAQDARQLWAHVALDRIEAEAAIMRQELGVNLTPVVLAAIGHLIALEDRQQRVRRLIEVWKLFAPGQSDPLEAEIERVSHKEGTEDLHSLLDVQKAGTVLCDVLAPVAPELWELIAELASSKELVGFVRDRMTEDFRNLIDAVEEHSDRFIREETVSGLIDVRRFLGQVLDLPAQGPIRDFTSQLCRHLQNIPPAVMEQLTVRLRDCNANVHGLKRLFSSVANRGELTKQIVLEVLAQGQMRFFIEPPAQECQVEVTIGERTLGNAELQDLRSRALLIVNSERHAQPKPVGHADDQAQADPAATPDDDHDESPPDTQLRQQLRAFIDLVELAQDISALASDLCLQGHFNFARFHFSPDRADHSSLDSIKQRLSGGLAEWRDLLDQTRRSCYYMCFFFAHQLRVLDECFSQTNPAPDVLQEFFHLLRFVDPSIPCTKKLCCGRYTAGLTIRERLNQLAEELGRLFADRAPAHKTLLGKSSAMGASSATLLGDCEVQPGRLFLATTQKAHMLHVVTSLYLSSGAYPWPSHLLFCTTETQWEELHLLLMRCFFAAESIKFGEGLFCIANIEALDFGLQSQLVDAMHELSREASASSSSRHRLALVCCKEGSKRHHIVEEFADHVRATAGVTDDTLQKLLRANCPPVHTVTSDLPGAGKTELAKAVAFGQKLGSLSLSVAGPITRAQLLDKLKAARPRADEALHIDIGAGVDGEMLNTFLFELLLTEMVTAGTTFYYLRPPLVLLEVANAASNDLVNSVPICFLFPHQHLRCTVDRVIVSQEPTSPMQVVCQFLHALSVGTLNERDLIFDGARANAAALPDDRCRELLQQHFFAKCKGDLSFTIMTVFLNSLSLQLRSFSRSYYFTVANLQAMIGPNDVRQLAVTSLMEACLEFTTRSVTTCREEQTRSLTAVGSASLQMAERMVRMTRWAESNHLVVLFNRHNAHTISVLFRSLDLVPADVIRLLKSQAVLGHEGPLAGQGEALLPKLERITRVQAQTAADYPPYALTTDNLLKMVLIYQRIQAWVPVVLMGETGCGKTSLVNFLAHVVGIPFRCLNVHAGTTTAAIEQFVAEAEEELRRDASTKAVPGRVWLFFDEINTSEHIGLINDIVCHRLLRSRPIHPGISLLAACNPYRLRGKQTRTAGLAGRVQSDDQSRLVYRVHPLPETMMDYVWDFGSLEPQAERFYISSIVDSLLGAGKWPRQHCELLVSLLSISQSFVRQRETDWSVSLRDVRRCIGLVEWFGEHQVCVQPKPKSGLVAEFVGWVAGRPNRVDVTPPLRAMILALAHCYHCRFADHNVRKEYRARIAHEMQQHLNGFSEENFAAVLDAEQRAYLNLMELRPGTALNGALLENVFVVLVCIINRIPVFLVGKPGCSKSLSLQLINANLRGPDSKSEYFRRLPSVYMVSYQGSESSTSEGISAVFQKAQKYREHNAADHSNVIPVVLLDEVGLAEASAYNPLKVLHSLLEPGYPKERPDVAVVGISNWSLDAAKMNRAIHLSRPEPDVDDLFETGRSIQQLPEHDFASARLISALATAYHDYYRTQSRPNFHGLRDYYSLVKCLAQRSGGWRQLEVSELVDALARNFGGLPAQMNRIQEIFVNSVQSQAGVQDLSPPPVVELIEANLRDVEARHLMLVTEGESAINILGGLLRSREPIVIYGSHYPDDQTEHYSYRILSRIILCMETGKCLILKDLEHIYGSLYDMLNQNYTVVGSKRNCRIALGAFSNPMCHVHQDFRCIVLVDQAKLDQADPPFLNRFEKQLLTYDSIMGQRQKVLAQQLGEWARSFATILREGRKLNFTEADAFIGFGEGTLASLVLKHTRHSDKRPAASGEIYGDDTDDSAVLLQCQRDLINVCPVDAILRCPLSQLARDAPEQVELVRDIYFQQQAHMDFVSFLEHALTAHESHDDMILDHSDELTSPAAHASGGGVKVLVNTFANIHVDLGLSPEDHPHVLLKPGTFTSERDLNTHIREFWRASSGATLLVIQCDLEMDAEYLQLAKFAVDQHAAEYVKNAPIDQKKHVCILIHTDRTSALSRRRLPFNFLSGWQLATVDVLERQEQPLTSLLDCTLPQLLRRNSEGDSDSQRYAFRRILIDSLSWCFCTIRYPANQESLARVRRLVREIAQSPEMQACFEERVFVWIAENAENVENAGRDWCLHVACDRQRLTLAHTLREAIHQYVVDMVRRPTAMLLCCLERQSALTTFFECAAEPELLQLWREFFVDPDVTDIRAMVPATAPEAYPIDPAAVLPGRTLKIPFSAHLFARFETLRQLFLDDLLQLTMDDDDQVTLRDLRARYRELAACAVPPKAAQLLVQHAARYLDDFIVLADVGRELGPDHQMAGARWLLASFGLSGGDGNDGQASSPLDCHIVWWEHSAKIAAMSRVLAALASVTGSLDDLLATLSSSKGLGALSSANDRLLVARACVEFLPRKRVVDHFDGSVQEWRRAASAVLSHASKGREPPQLMHVLRVFADLSALVPFAEPGAGLDVQLFELAEVAYVEREGLLASREVFGRVMQIVARLTSSTAAPPGAIYVALHFQRLFLARCLDCAHDSPLIPDMLASLPIASAAAAAAAGTGASSSFMAPVLVRLLASAEDCLAPASLFDLLCSANTDPGSSNSNNVWLEAIAGWIDTHGPHSPEATFCCDVLHQHFAPDFTALVGWSPTAGGSTHDDCHYDGELAMMSTDEQAEAEAEANEQRAIIMEYLEGALQTLFDAKPSAFQLVLAVAFLRGLLAFIATHLEDDEDGEDEDYDGEDDDEDAVHPQKSLDEDHPVVVRLRNLFVEPHDRSFAMQVYLLKRLRLSRSLQEVRRACIRRRRLLPSLDGLPWEVKTDSPLGFNPFARLGLGPDDPDGQDDHYRRAEELLLRLCLVQREGSQLLAFLDDQAARKGGPEPRAVASLLGAVGHHIYFLNARRGAELPSSHKIARDWLLEHLPTRLPANAWRVGKALLFNKGAAFHLNSGSSSRDLHLRTVLAHLLLTCAVPTTGGSSLLRQCVTDLAALARSFVPAMPSDELSAVLRGMGEAVTRYACACGYVYVVANCGATMQLSTCPACRGPIGGASHRALPHQRRLDSRPQSGADLRAAAPSQRGYVAESEEALRSLHHSARELPPLAYRAVHLLVHAALLVGLDTGFTTTTTTTIPSVPALMRIVEGDWAALRQLLNSTDEELGIGLHCLVERLQYDRALPAGPLTTEKLRLDWERCAVAAVGQIFGNLHASAAAYLARQQGAGTGDGLNLLVAEIEERVELATNDDYRLKFLPTLFRVTLPNTYDSLKAAAHTAGGDQAPRFLQLLFGMEERLEQLAHLLPLVAWTSFVSARLRYKVTRKNARETTIAQFIAQAGGSGAGAGPVAAQYREFEQAWNAVRSNVTRLGCRELTMPHMSDALSISHCCVEPTDEGAYVCAAFEFLAALQNDFLDRVLQLAAEGHAALKHLEPQNGVGGIRSVNVQDVDRSHVVRYQWPERVLLFAEHDLRYGHGRQLRYDMAKIEAELAQLFVYGKAHIDTHTLDQFSFHAELPHTVGETLREVRKLVPQEPLPDHHRQQIGDAVVQQEVVAGILGLLGVLLSFVKRTSGQSTRSLENYCREWGLDAGLVALLRRHGPLMSALTLAHVTALYEAIEERAADKLARSLDAQYATPLDERLRHCLRELMKRLPPASVVQALQRCVVRYIACDDAGGGSAANPDIPLNMYLVEADGAPSSLWPELPASAASVNLAELLPDGLLAAHITTALHFATKLLAERTPAPKSAATAATTRARVQTTRRKKFGGDAS